MSDLDKISEFNWERILDSINSCEPAEERENIDNIESYIRSLPFKQISDTDIFNLCSLALSNKLKPSSKRRISYILHEFGFTRLNSDEEIIQAANALEMRAPIGTSVRDIANEDFALALLVLVSEKEIYGKVISDKEAILMAEDILSKPNRFAELLKDYPIIPYPSEES